MSKRTQATLWKVFRIQGSKAAPITVLKAADAEQAVARVIEDLSITDRMEQRRLFARPALE